MKTEPTGRELAVVLVILIVVFALQACAAATTMPPGVHATTADNVEGCAAIGTVRNDAMHDLTLKLAMADMAKSAKARGGNTLVILDQREGFNGVKMLAAVYYCDKFK